METLSVKSKKSSTHIGWMILACIPFLNWSGFLAIGSAANQKKWTILGYIHFVLSLASASLFAAWVVSHDFLAIPYNNLDKLFPYLMFVSWLIGVVQAWWIFGEAKKRLARQLAVQEVASSTQSVPMTRKERIRSNLVYILFALVPISGLSLVHIGKTIRRKKLQIFGWVSFALCILLEIAFVFLFIQHDKIPEYNYTLDAFYYRMDPMRPLFTVLTQMTVLLFWVVALLICIRTKSEYTVTSAEHRNAYNEGLRQRKEEHEQLKQLYPCLQSTAWKIKKSVYLLWCLPVITSPIALIHVGISDRKWKRLACGIGSLLYEVFFIAYGLAVGYWNYLEWLSYTLTILLFALWIVIIWFSIASLRSHLIYAAKKSGGYCDAFDAEEAQRITSSQD